DQHAHLLKSRIAVAADHVLPVAEHLGGGARRSREEVHGVEPPHERGRTAGRAGRDELLLDQHDPTRLLAGEVIGEAGAVDAAPDDDDIRRLRDVYHYEERPGFAGDEEWPGCAGPLPSAGGVWGAISGPPTKSMAMPASQCGLNWVGMPNQLTQPPPIAGASSPGHRPLPPPHRPTFASQPPAWISERSHACQ